MKLTNLNEFYLKGIVDGKIADFNENCNTIPEELNLSYSIEFITKVGLIGQENHPSNSAKITFNWIEDGEWVTVDEDTDSREYKGSNGFDHFTILAGERVVKLQLYVEEILERLTNP